MIIETKYAIEEEVWIKTFDRLINPTIIDTIVEVTDME